MTHIQNEITRTRIELARINYEFIYARDPTHERELTDKRAELIERLAALTNWEDRRWGR